MSLEEGDDYKQSGFKPWKVSCIYDSCLGHPGQEHQRQREPACFRAHPTCAAACVAAVVACRVSVSTFCRRVVAMSSASFSFLAATSCGSGVRIQPDDQSARTSVIPRQVYLGRVKPAYDVAPLRWTYQEFCWNTHGPPWHAFVQDSNLPGVVVLRPCVLQVAQ